MNVYAFVNVVTLVILTDNIVAQSSTAMKPGPCTPCEGVVCAAFTSCADGTKPVKVGCCLKCMNGATSNDCFGVVCQPDKNCRTKREIWPENECCPRCADAFNDCTNVYCSWPTRNCLIGEKPLPSGACCPKCIELTVDV